MIPSHNCRRIHDLAILGVYALLGVALFQIDFSNATGRRRRIIGSTPTFAQALSKNSELLFSQEAEVCQQSQCTAFRQIDSTEVQFRDLHHLFTGNGVLASSKAATMKTPNDYAICEFQNMDAYNFHFPHAMQQLYRCWSWWRLRRTCCPDETPVLVFLRSTMPDNAFLLGFSASLQASIGLEIWTPHQFQLIQQQQTLEKIVQPRVPNNRVNPVNIFGMADPTCPYYAMHQVDDARELRDIILRRRSDGPTDGCGDGAKPRIAILNRHNHREWLNVDAVVQRLRRYAANGEIPIVFFESNATFVEQISFFRNVDVLLSPHGAQLTGLPFMPDCGGVMEVLPAGYYLPYFFGSLALASSLQHGFVSLTHTGDWRTESAEGMQSQNARQKVRNKQLCPDVDAIVNSVLQMIDGWNACCGAAKDDWLQQHVAPANVLVKTNIVNGSVETNYY